MASPCALASAARRSSISGRAEERLNRQQQVRRGFDEIVAVSPASRQPPVRQRSGRIPCAARRRAQKDQQIVSIRPRAHDRRTNHPAWLSADTPSRRGSTCGNLAIVSYGGDRVAVARGSPLVRIASFPICPAALVKHERMRFWHRCMPGRVAGISVASAKIAAAVTQTIAGNLPFAAGANDLPARFAPWLTKKWSGSKREGDGRRPACRASGQPRRSPSAARCQRQRRNAQPSQFEHEGVIQPPRSTRSALP